MEIKFNTNFLELKALKADVYEKAKQLEEALERLSAFKFEMRLLKPSGEPYKDGEELSQCERDRRAGKQ